jgi:acyl carrier protein
LQIGPGQPRSIGVTTHPSGRPLDPGKDILRRRSNPWEHQYLLEEQSVETKVLDQAELVNQILDVIVKEGMVDREKVTLDATIESLDLKSIDIVMILTAIEEKFDVYIPMDGPFHDAKNVRDLIDAIAAYIIKEKA